MGTARETPCGRRAGLYIGWFCSGAVAAAVGHHTEAHEQSAQGDEHIGHDHEHHHPGHEVRMLCPFALAAGTCSVDIPYVAVDVDRPSFAPVPFESASLPSIPPRAERIRGPPAVS